MTKNQTLGLRIVSMLLCVVCLLSLVRPVPVSAEEAEEPAGTLTTVVRNGGYAGARVIGQMQNGTAVSILDERGDYYKVDCYDMTGYIAKSQILHKEDGKSYVNCAEDSSETRTMAFTDHGDALLLRHSLLELAQQQLGYPYVYGGSRPGGFDCSGLMYYLYGQHAISLHRTASAQLQDGIVVAKEGMQVGDLVFFRESWSPYPASHVGIYVGNNQIIHAGNSGIVYADLDDSYCSNNFLCARRIVNTDGAQMEEAPVQPGARIVATRGGISGRRAG